MGFRPSVLMDNRLVCDRSPQAYDMNACMHVSTLFMHTHTCMHAAESTYARAQAWQQQQEKAEGAAEQSDKLKEGWRVLVQGRRMGSRGVTNVSA